MTSPQPTLGLNAEARRALVLPTPLVPRASHIRPPVLSVLLIHSSSFIFFFNFLFINLNMVLLQEVSSTWFHRGNTQASEVDIEIEREGRTQGKKDLRVSPFLCFMRVLFCSQYYRTIKYKRKRRNRIEGKKKELRSAVSHLARASTGTAQKKKKKMREKKKKEREVIKAEVWVHLCSGFLIVIQFHVSASPTPRTVTSVIT